MDVYMKGMMYETQEERIKEIGIDSASYLFRVDCKKDVIYTDSDGYWGSYQEFVSRNNGKEFVMELF